MNVPYGWLEELLPDAPPAGELVELLPGLGLEVEQALDLPAAPRGALVVRVESVAEVKDSEHLLQAIVTDGEHSYNVVTGAPNARAGMLTALAKPGTVLPGSLRVSEQEMAGVRSEGMLCSPRELGLYDYAGGLIAFADDTPIGAELYDLWPAETVLEVEITPNRADCFSILGIARDLAAKLEVPYRHPAAGLEVGNRAEETGLNVVVDDPAACPRFTLRLIEGVTVGPSPVWLQRRLAALGLRPRNNLVDVTNYVTFELGQPSHAYDREVLTDGTIVVRRARAGERLLALNEEELTFSLEDLLITTPTIPPDPPYQRGQTKPIGVAGVIGGLNYSVKADTKAVALEVAHFDPVTVRKAAKRLGLSTDASMRFERGVDPNLPPLAAARAAALIAELGGGRVHPGLTEVGGDVAPCPVAFRPSRVAFLMAMEIPLDEQRASLERLGCRVEACGPDDWRVTPPSWRFDIGIEEDVIEEVSRLHGYEHIPESLPEMAFVPGSGDSTYHGLRSLLVGLGLQEALTYTFSSDEELARAAAPPAAVRLKNPPSMERSVLRTALYPGLLAAARTNHAAESLALFEIGRVFPEGEAEHLALLLRGPWVQGGWLKSQPLDFFVLKGLLKKLAETLGAGLEVTPEAYPHLHPGVSGALFWEGRKVGWLGRLHPAVAARYELPETYLAEVELPLAAPEISFEDFTRQPFAERDLAVIAPLSVSYASLAEMVRDAAGPQLVSLTPFDIYAGEPVPAGQRSLALRLRFRNPERALEGAEVERDMADIISALREAGYDIRDS